MVRHQHRVAQTTALIAVALLSCGATDASEFISGESGDLRPPGGVQPQPTAGAAPEQSRANPALALGKPVDDPAVQALVGNAYKNCFVDGAGHFQCPLSGVTLVISAVNDQLTVRGMFLYPNASGSTAPYLGSLPGGLTRDLDADGVHAKLGMPTAAGNAWEQYNNRKPAIGIMYMSGTQPEKRGLIARIQI